HFTHQMGSLPCSVVGTSPGPMATGRSCWTSRSSFGRLRNLNRGWRFGTREMASGSSSGSLDNDRSSHTVLPRSGFVQVLLLFIVPFAAPDPDLVRTGPIQQYADAPARLDQLNRPAGRRQPYRPHTDHLDLLGAHPHGLAADPGGRGPAVRRRPDPN